MLPAIRHARPGARFFIVGSNPAEDVKRLATLDGVTVTGPVPDVRPYISHATASVAPMRVARGIQNKVLEAMAMGRPVIVTPGALEGIDAVPGRDVILAGDATSFAQRGDRSGGRGRRDKPGGCGDRSGRAPPDRRQLRLDRPPERLRRPGAPPSVRQGARRHGDRIMNDQLTAMPDEPLSQEAPEETVIVWGTLAGLAIGLIAIGALFHTEIATGVRTWYISTAYNHCFLVIPIAAWLAWDRRASLQGLAPAAIPLAALLAVPLAVAWLVAERLGIMEGRQLVMITLVQVLFLALLGRRLYLALLGPLLYLYFLVPFGEFLTPKLQDVTTWFIRHGVDILGSIPGMLQTVTSSKWRKARSFVAEACAGSVLPDRRDRVRRAGLLRRYRSPMRRIIFITASIIVPIISRRASGALGIVYLGHVQGSA